MKQVLQSPDKLVKGVENLIATTGVSVLAHASAEATAKGELAYVDGSHTKVHLGISASAQADSFFKQDVLLVNSSASASAGASFYDELQLTGDGEFPVIGPLLEVIWSVNGYITGGGENWGGDAQVSLTGGGAFATYQYSRGHVNGNDYTYEFNTSGPSFLASITLTPGAEKEASYSISLSGGCGMYDGFCEVGYNHTAELVRIQFLDGSTPEEHGFTIEFGSGVTSPNLLSANSVPEPGTLALAGMGAFGLVAGAIRRRRQQKSAV